MAQTKTTTGRGSGTKARPPKEPKEEPAAAAEEPQAREHVCNVAFCPIGLALSTMQGAAPDVMEHLLKAAQEFLLAARAVIDNRAKDFEGRPDDAGLRRIEIT
jgi:hypothetical protein